MTEHEKKKIAEALGLNYEPYYSKIPDYFCLPDGFFTIMEEGPKQEWWLHFLLKLQNDIHPDGACADIYFIHYSQINPSRMARTLLEFLEGKG